jgi:PadR family transcriptional regulator PadR
MNAQDQLPLAPRDLLILAVLAEGPLHGYGIIKAVEDRSEAGVLLDPANLYRVLRRMRGLGWIKEAPSGSTDASGQGDSRRRTYEIAPGGRTLLAAELARLERLLHQVRPALAKGAGL